MRHKKTKTIKDVAAKTEDVLSKTKTVKDVFQRRKTPKTNDGGTAFASILDASTPPAPTPWRPILLIFLGYALNLFSITSLRFASAYSFPTLTEVRPEDAVSVDHDERIDTVDVLNGAHIALWGRSLALSTALKRKGDLQPQTRPAPYAKRVLLVGHNNTIADAQTLRIVAKDTISGAAGVIIVAIA
ncbi:hypothetical protein C8R45DRAFT_1217536 [Mycena sanguinolenta]|nr:hypothetical protein C8R45DRAFT_1217536 [Mycena sanguinolenta]